MGEMRELWSKAVVPTGQAGEVIGVYQDRPKGDLNYLIRYTDASSVRHDDWFNEHEIYDLANMGSNKG